MFSEACPWPCIPVPAANLIDVLSASLIFATIGAYMNSCTYTDILCIGALETMLLFVVGAELGGWNSGWAL
jgi:hypothetical protein